MARKPGYIYLPVDVEFMEDEKIAEAGERAAWLYLGMCLRSKQLVSDGVLTARAVERLPISGTRQRLARLIAVGLVEKLDGNRYRVIAWEKHNSTSSDLIEKAAKKAAGAQLGNHRRWHEERGVTDPSCDHCAISTGSVHRSHSESTKTEGEAETETLEATPSRKRDEPEGFSSFWMAYPRKIAKGAAVKAYAKALKTTTPDVLLAAASRFASERLGQDEKFTPHPSTWLNAQRWDDAPPQDELKAWLAAHPHVNPADEYLIPERLLR